jgi:hypothetical protein
MEVMAETRPPHSPHWYGVPVRVGLLTFLGTLLTFAVTLLFAIFGTVIDAAVRGIHPDMRMAYRHIALPIALVAGAIILVATAISETRRYRQVKALTAIERLG